MKNQKRTLYSIFPPPIGGVVIALMYGGFLPLVFFLLIMIFINTIILSLVLMIILYLTGNKHAFTLRQIFIKGFIVTLITDIYSLIAGFNLEVDPSRQYYPPFSYAVSPDFYNFVTMFLAVGILSFLSLYFIFKRAQINKKLLVLVLTAIITLPWFSGYIFKFEKKVSTDISTSVSLKEQEELASKVKYEIQGVELLYLSQIENEYKTLVVKTTITVPRSGIYNLIPRLTLSSPNFHYETFEEDGFQGYFITGQQPAAVYINNERINLDTYTLHEGENNVMFQFPYVYLQGGKKALNIKSVNGEGKVFGPYIFDFGIKSLQTNTGAIEFNVGSKPFYTPIYSYKDFFR